MSLTGGLLPALDGAFGDSPGAVTIAGERCSWESLAGRASAIASRLAGLDRAALCATPTIETVAGVVGGLLAGVTIVPVAPDAGPIERAHVLADSAAGVLLGEPPWPEAALPRIPCTPGRAGQLPTPETLARRPALVMYTSGTTGPPKGAVLGRAAIASDLDGLAEAWAWSAQDTLVHGLPLFHVHGLILGVLGALRHGSRLVHTGRPTPQAYAAAGGSLYFGVPTVWSRLAGDPAAAAALRPARLLVSGSAALPVAVFERLAGHSGHRPVERYGMTETLITLSTRADGERRPGHVGFPVAGVETRLVGDDGSPVAHDGETIGHLQVRGGTLFDGYLGNPRATVASYTPDRWFVTGDSATIGPDGFHRIAGRTSVDIIKTGGFKVGAGEVEAALAAHRAVREVAVVGVPDDDLGQRIVAFVVADGVTAEDLAAFVAAGLSVHKRPRQVHLVDALPRNAMGKVIKTALEA